MSNEKDKIDNPILYESHTPSTTVPEQKNAWFEQFLENDLSMYKIKVEIDSADVIKITLTKRPDHDLEDK